MTLHHYYIESALAPGAALTLPAPLSRRLTVVRRGSQESIGLFNGRDGLFEAEVDGGRARVTRQLKPFTPCPPLELWLGLPKREAFETSLRMATELGATRIVPLLCDFTIKKDINGDRAQALMIEAAEQCERLDLPVLEPVRKFDGALARLTTPLAWAAARPVNRKGPEAAEARAVLVGPEGGFSPVEEQLLMAHPWVTPFTLGATVLRVDTAVAAGLALLKA